MLHKRYQAVKQLTGFMIGVILGVIPVMLFAQPVAEFTANNVLGCTPMVVQFTDQSTGNITDWEWDFGNGNTSTQQNPGAIYIQPGVYTVTLKVTDNQAQTDSIFKVAYITVYGSPESSFSVDVREGCVPLTVQFTDESVPLSSGINSWLWEFGDGNVSTQQHPVHTYTLPGLYTVYLKVEDGNGCDHAFYINNYIHALRPTADFIMPPAACPIPATVNFNNTSIGSPLTYSWDFGDTTFSTATHPTHTYNHNGLYDVTLAIVDTNNCTDTLTKTINISNIGADFGFEITDTDCETGFSVDFTDSSGGGLIDNWDWDFGDGNTSGLQDPLHQYNTFGTFNVKLIAGSGSSCLDTIVKAVTYNPPKALLVPDSSGNCALPFTINFQNQSNGTGQLTYDWDLIDTAFTSNDPSVSYTYQREDSFFISLIATDFLNCIDTMLDTIVIRKPKAAFKASTKQGCAPLTVAFIDTSNSIEPITSWDWDFGDGNVGSGLSLFHTYNDTGKYTVRLIIVNEKGCTDTLIKEDYIIAGLKPDIVDFQIIPGDTVCYQDTLRFEDLSGFINPQVSINNWTWDIYSDVFPNKHTVNDTNIVTWSFNEQYAGPDSVDVGGGNKIFLSGIDSVMLIAGHNGCNDTMIKPIFIYIPVAIDAYLGPTTACAAPYTLTMYNASYGYTDFLGWEIKNTETSQVLATGITDTTTMTFNNSGRYSYTVRVRNDTSGPGGTGCTSVEGHEILVDSAVAEMSVAPLESCLKNNAFSCENLSYSKYGLVTDWFWAFGDGDTLWKSEFIAPDSVILPKFSHKGRTTGTYEAPVHTYQDSGSYTISLFINVTLPSSLGSNVTCGYVTTRDIQVNHTYIDISADNQGGCPGVTINFTDLSASNSSITSWQWDFGDGFGDNVPNPSHAYQSAGTYDVTLITNDSKGCTDTLVKSDFLVIGAAPVDFEADDPVVCLGDTVYFSNVVNIDTLDYLWDFGDGNTDTLMEPYHVYQTADTFTVSLTISNKTNCDSTQTRTDYVIVGGLPTADFDPQIVNDDCPPLPLQLTDSSSSDVVEWLWDFGDGQFSSVQHPIHVFTTSGSFDVQLIVTNAAGCKDTLFRQNYVTISGPSEDIQVKVDSGCVPQPVTFVARATNTAYYLWDFGDGNVLDGVTPIEGGDSVVNTYLAPGSYVPNLVLVSTTNCVLSIPALDTILVDQVSAGFNLTNTVFCSLDSVMITDSSYSFFTADRHWRFGDGQTATGIVDGHAYTTPGDYTIEQLVVSTIDESCRDSLSQNITVFKQPGIIFVEADSLNCVPALARFVAGNTTPEVTVEQWRWNFGDGDSTTGDTVVHLYEQPGGFNLTLSAIYGDEQCRLDTTLPVVVMGYPTADFSFSPEFPTLQDPSVTFTDQSEGAVQWLWLFDTGDSSSEQHPVHAFQESGSYMITLIAANEANCADTVTKELVMFPDILIKVPNAFTPNGDGVNDRFYIFHAGIEELIVFRIFNRWGELVFETSDIDAGWDGIFKGKEQDTDTYVYYISAKTFSGEEATIKGNFTLIR